MRSTNMCVWHDHVSFVNCCYTVPRSAGLQSIDPSSCETCRRPSSAAPNLNSSHTTRRIQQRDYDPS